MIIVLGPDHSGKSTLVKKLAALKGQDGYPHHSMNTKYEEYLQPLASLSWTNTVMDRHMICEIPYHKVMDRPFGYTTKQFHNIMLLTLMQNPVVILTTHKPTREVYDHENQYLPFDLWQQCMDEYVSWLKANEIMFFVFDYEKVKDPSFYLKVEATQNKATEWWQPLWQAGYGPIGGWDPDILLVAERLGPSNVNNLPFETGPTGHMLTDTFTFTRVPLSAIAITNIVKAPRGDGRKANKKDLELLELEIDNLRPKGIVFIGSVALNAGQSVARNLNVRYTHVTHYGAYHRQRVSDMSPFNAEMAHIFKTFREEA